jgi:hypothetical protein
VAGLVSLLAGGCAEPLTQLVLVVDTDIPLASPNPAIPVEPDQLRELTLSLYGPCEGMDCPEQFVDSAQQYNLPGGEAPPYTVGLLLESDLLGPFRIEGAARVGPESSQVEVPLRVVTSFTRGETRVVQLHFLSECVGRTCPAGQSCSAGGTCEPDARAPEELPVWTGSLDDFAIAD